MIDVNQASHEIAKMCRVLGVSRSAFYRWRDATPTVRDLEDEVIGDVAEAAWEDSRESYGLPRLLAEVNERLEASGSELRVGNRRLRRIMAVRNIRGQSRRRAWKGCTRRDPRARPAPDLLERDFTATGPDQRWVSDITEVATLDGPVWACVVTDVWSRRIVGWSIADHHRAELVAEAVNMALGRRRPAAGVVLHSDQGSEYTAWATRQLCKANGVVQSMGSVGDCFDNAMAESVFATIETELLWNHTFTGLADASFYLIDFIEGWYNTGRRHTSIGNIPPVQFELEQSIMYNYPAA